MIQFLRGTQSQLQSSQQIFAAGQPIFESDTGQLKIGNGINNFAGLPYVGNSSGNQVVEGDIDQGHIDFGDVAFYFGTAEYPNQPITSNNVNRNGSINYTYSANSLTFAYPGWECKPIPVPDNRFEDILAVTVYTRDKGIWCYSVYPDANGIHAEFAWSSDFNLSGPLLYYYQYWIKN